MEIKSGVTLRGLQPIMRPVLREAERIWKDYGREFGVTVTEACGGTHSASSWHYYGYALDLRTRYFPDEVKTQVYEELKGSCKDYDIILHSTHIHAEISNSLANQLGVLY